MEWSELGGICRDGVEMQQELLWIGWVVGLWREGVKPVEDRNLVCGRLEWRGTGGVVGD